MKTDMNQPGRDCELMTIVIIPIVIIILFIIYVVRFCCMTPCFFDGLNVCPKHKELLCWSLWVPFCLLVALLIMIVVYFMKAKKKLKEEQEQAMDLKKFQMDREWKMDYIKYKDKIELIKLGINMSKEDEKKMLALEVNKEIASYRSTISKKIDKFKNIFTNEIACINKDNDFLQFTNCLPNRRKDRINILSLYWEFCEKKKELMCKDLKVFIEKRKDYIKLYYPGESEEFNRKVESLRMEYENQIEEFITDEYNKQCEIFKKII